MYLEIRHNQIPKNRIMARFKNPKSKIYARKILLYKSLSQ